MSKDSEDPPTQEPGTSEGFDAIEPSPPFRPDPDLITYLERQAKPGEVKAWLRKHSDREF
jgi:hypothetical protein